MRVERTKERRQVHHDAEEMKLRGGDETERREQGRGVEWLKNGWVDAARAQEIRGSV